MEKLSVGFLAMNDWVMIPAHHARLAESYFYDFLLTHFDVPVNNSFIDFDVICV